MKRWRVYADTSVFGGCCDEEFAADSRRLMDEFRIGRYVVAERIEFSDEIERLRDAYLAAGIVGPAGQIRGYHAVNLLHGYRPIPIHTPREVIQP